MRLYVRAFYMRVPYQVIRLSLASLETRLPLSVVRNLADSTL